MQTQQHRWQSYDEVELQGYHWPSENVRFVVGIVHGLGEHAGRYEHVASFFLNHGIATLAYDRRGHGLSEGKKGHAENLNVLLDEITCLLEKMKYYYPDIPAFLYGHSMGGNLVLNYLLQRMSLPDGVIATGSWIQLVRPPSPALLKAARLVNRIYPGFSQSNGLNPNDLSVDPLVVENYRKDPLVHDRISVSTALTMIEAATTLEHFEEFFPRPVLLMHGLEDKITDYRGSEQLALRCPLDVTWKPWPGMRHEIHNEPGWQNVVKYVVEWMENVVNY